MNIHSFLDNQSNNITITGSREIKENEARPLFEEYLHVELGKNHRWILGGALGIDTWALKWLNEKQEKCIIIVPFFKTDQPIIAKKYFPLAQEIIELKLNKTKASYMKRNSFMVDHSFKVWGFWTKKGGTLKTIHYAIRKKKIVNVIPVFTDDEDR